MEIPGASVPDALWASQCLWDGLIRLSLVDESTLSIGHQAIRLIRTECVDLSAPPTFDLNDAVRQ
tara:strand:+ start:587 stop:781 length:195 start_codon:yes stop_codon:yes gene_type:complete